MEQTKENQSRRWTKQEEDRVIRQIKAFPQNLHKCFLLVSDEIGRSPSAVENRWYTKISKRDDVQSLCFFTASAKHVSKNRKNGMGEDSNPGIWRKLITVLKSLGK